ncbi:iron-sulfur cluster repair di-iron protein [Thalassobacillus pellis]|uniref:iron-sulfur cluster repair di-iron protein n=1 Tax=Thalassobacillus pellis TaxID=748008 RepID=UPI00196003B1|nr:iron-sulfur cluster repair di-iron protein [Thalassobacillus pellis]MBM7552965.1 regulator of cell morphogenesis and NO signaling [Thalassobacillus pellis]
MTTFTREHTPADIVNIYPKASDLFKKNRIDFCCGGDRPLGEVFDKQKIDEDMILTKLNENYTEWVSKGNQAADWDAVSNTELVDHIVYTHHAFLNEELPALGQFVSKIFRVHGDHHPHLRELHKLYNELKTELEAHLIKEETEVFPLVKEYDENPSEELRNRIHAANGTLENEHDHAGDILKQIHTITGGFEPPQDACNSYRITYKRLAELEEDTFQHIHLENNILFKRI